MSALLPKSGFIDDLIRWNRLHVLDFECFLFFKGMLFNSHDKWWGKKGRRQFSHEGLDLCFFKNSSGQFYRLDESVGVPMMYDGRIEHITDDFLGKTVIASHKFDSVRSDERARPAFLSLYGHLDPDINLRIGDEIEKGQVFAKIAGFGNKKRLLPPHLHVSLANPRFLPPAGDLEWEFLNTVDRKNFIDPMEILAPAYQLMDYDAPMDLHEQFIPCGRVMDA